MFSKRDINLPRVKVSSSSPHHPFLLVRGARPKLRLSLLPGDTETRKHLEAEAAHVSQIWKYSRSREAQTQLAT